MLAIVIMLISVVMMFGIMPISFGYVRSDSERLQAVAAGQQYLDRLHQYVQRNGNVGLPAATTAQIDSGGVLNGSGAAAAADGTMQISHNNCPTAASSASGLQFDCLVTVSWTEGGQGRTVRIESLIARQ